MGEGKPLLFYDPCGAQLFFYEVMKNGLILPDPGGKLLFDDLPHAVFALHSENNAISPIVAHINGEQSFVQAVRLAEVELSQASIGLDEFCELNVPNKLYLHKAPFGITG
jgi:hypothetical protein